MKRVLITGVSRGIGEAVARTMSAEPWEITGVYRRRHDEAQTLEAALAGRLTTVACDLGDERAVDALVDDWHGQFDAVVLNAGVAYRAPFVEDDVEGVDPLAAQLHLDLVAPLRLLRSLLRARRVAAGGAVVFVSSNLARRGLPGKVAYAAAKAGLEGACRGLARELGPQGVRVNCVAPGLLATDMTADMGNAGYESYGEEVPLGRVGHPSDVAGVGRFLLSDDARYVSGQVIDVDGGWSA